MKTRAVIAAFLLGLLIGAAMMVPFLGHQLESLLVEQSRLVQQLAQYRARLDQIEENREQPPERVVEQVDLEFLWSDEATRLDLSDRLSPLTGELVGRRLDRLDPYLIYAVFDGRVVELGSHRYHLRVRAAVLSEETVIILAVDEEDLPAGWPATGPREQGL